MKFLSFAQAFILFNCMVSFFADAHAQARFSADSYLADPEKYLGKSITVYVSDVSVPAINANTKQDFRIFRVYTSGREGNEYVGGGGIYMKVPLSEAASFVKRHNQKTSQAPKNVSGIFKKYDGDTSGYTSSLDYYIDCTKP
ncbi:MAG: hypothetical protein EB056_04285 [Verrucomicrobia bacterium]|nr:hypothetical protein [Verrucomicrobiota bacterium]